MATRTAIVSGPHARPHAAGVSAIVAHYLAFGRKDVDVGRFFTAGEVARNAQVVRVRERPFTVIGVMQGCTGERTYRVFVTIRAAAATIGARGEVLPSLIVRAARRSPVDAMRHD